VYCILPTAIFINKTDIIKAKKNFSKNVDYVITVVKENKSTLRNFYFDKKKLKMLAPKFINFRTQDLPSTFRDAGQLYLANKKTWIKKGKIFSSKTKAVLLNSKKYFGYGKSKKIAQRNAAYKLINSLNLNRK